MWENTRTYQRIDHTCFMFCFSSMMEEEIICLNIMDTPKKMSLDISNRMYKYVCDRTHSMGIGNGISLARIVCAGIPEG